MGNVAVMATARPRNSRLTAFYGLQQGTPVPSSPAQSSTGTTSYESPHPPGSPRNRVSDLISRTQLSALLTSAAALREKRDASHAAQNMSVQQCYAQLSRAVSAAASAARSSSSSPSPFLVEEGLSAARMVASDARQVDSNLAPARARFDSLEDARKVSLLLQAAELLAKDIPADYQALVELCLDPEGALARLQATAMRYAALASLFARAAEESSEFADAYKRVEEASQSVRADLEERMSAGSGAVEGMNLLDIVRIRMLLGDSSSNVMVAFLRASELSIVAGVPSTAAIEAASSSALSLAALHLAFATNSALPVLLATCDTFYDMFITSVTTGDADQANAEEFTSWLAQVVEIVVADRARNALTKFKSMHLGDVNLVNAFGARLGDQVGLEAGFKSVSMPDPFSKLENDFGNGAETCDAEFGTSADARTFAEQMKSLRSSSQAAAEDSKSAAKFGVHEVIGAVCDELQETVVSAFQSRAQDCVWSRAGTILSRDYAASSHGRIFADIDSLVRLVQTCQETLDSTIPAVGGQPSDLIEFVAESVIKRIAVFEGSDAEVTGSATGKSCSHLEHHSLRDVGKDEALAHPDFVGSRILLTGAAVMDALTRCTVNSQEYHALDLRQTRSQLLHVFCLRVSADVTSVLRASIPCGPPIEAKDEQIVGAQVSEAGCRAIALLEQARRDANAILGPSPDMDVAFGTEEEILDEGGIIQRIARGWVCHIRDETLGSVEAVHAIQVDSSALDVAMGTSRVFACATNAAVERCVATSVVLLAPSEVSRRIAQTAALS